MLPVFYLKKEGKCKVRKYKKGLKRTKFFSRMLSQYRQFEPKAQVRFCPTKKVE